MFLYKLFCLFEFIFCILYTPYTDYYHKNDELNQIQQQQQFYIQLKHKMEILRINLLMKKIKMYNISTKKKEELIIMEPKWELQQ